MTLLEELAEETVADMIALGCHFEVERGQNGYPTWVWRARPSSQRDAVARRWSEVSGTVGLAAAMTKAILYRQRGDVL